MAVARKRIPDLRSAPILAGGTELPAGKVGAVATYLEMTARPERLGIPDPRLRLEPLAGAPSRYRALYRGVGRDWLWFSRAGLTDAELGDVLDDPDITALALATADGDAGLLELDFRRGGECELAFFGLVGAATGAGLGRRLIVHAIDLAFRRPIRRLWLHTCTLDHPAALPFYVAAGFRPYRRAIEIADDPRLTGRLPREAAPNLPIL